ncbi:MAG: GerMN domain-containing protein [Patescibacteria group bacterium]
MKKNYLLIIVGILTIIIGVMAFFLMKDNEVNSNNSLNSNQQQNTNTTINTNYNSNSSTQSDIQVTQPLPGETISSPLTVTGSAKGNWFFEAVFPIQIVDEDNNQIGFGNAEAIGDWQTENFVNFTAQLTFTKSTVTSGFIVLQNANPSGLKELEKELRIPISFNDSTQSEVEIFLGKESNQQTDCSAVFAVKRSINNTPQIATAAINQLLAGPTNDEKTNGFTTNISSPARLISLNINNGTAYADFSAELNNVSGSCAVQMVRSQIENTLKQFSTVQGVIISVNGETEGILQP